VFRAAPEALSGIGKQFAAKIVAVSSFAIEKFPKLAFMYHAQD